jgi:NAD+ synthase (glutamine-hydrolysing)
MEREVHFSLAQIEVKSGHPNINVEKILEATERAKERKTDIILFPELSVSGYLLGDEWENDYFIRDLMQWNQKILAASRGITVVWGNVQVDWDKKNEDGTPRKYNAAHIAQNGHWVGNGVFEGHTYKTLLPEYREFHDPRHFYSMQKLADEQDVALSKLLKPFPIDIKGHKVLMGAILCEDMWCMDYSVNPTHILVRNGADVIVNLSCSPWTWKKNDKRHRVVYELLKGDPIPFLYNNNVGTQDNGKNMFLFDGNSTVYNSDGSLMFTSKPYEENIFDVTIGGKRKVVVPRPELSTEKDLEELHDGIVYGIKRFFENLSDKKVVVGVSGGIDSAVVASLVTEALGSENVFLINMPSNFNSDLTKDAAKELAQNLGANYTIAPIQEVVDLTIDQLTNLQFENPDGVKTKLTINSAAIENIQARDRGSRLLAGIAAGLGAVFTNNGNKTETTFGYCTKYGDLNGAIAPIADTYKWEVYELARYINRNAGRTIIPDDSITVVPSAELSAEQDVTKGKGDPFIYPYHDQLARAFVEFRRDPEYVLELYIAGGLEKELRIPGGLVKKIFPTHKDFITDLEKRWSDYKGSIHKRIIAPKIIAVSKRAFGFDLQESENGVYFTQRYLKLKKELLNTQRQE